MARLLAGNGQESSQRDRASLAGLFVRDAVTDVVDTLEGRMIFSSCVTTMMAVW